MKTLRSYENQLLSTRPLRLSARSEADTRAVPHASVLTIVLSVTFALLMSIAVTSACAPSRAYAQPLPAAAHETSATRDGSFDPLDLLPAGEEAKGVGVADQVQLLSINETFDALRQDLNIVDFGYSATGAAYNEAFNIVGTDYAMPDDARNIFWIDNNNPLSGLTTYCLLIQTNIGSYFVTRDFAYDAPSFGEAYALDFESDQSDVLYYSPTTLEEYVDADTDTQPTILDNWQLVTEENIESIPIPDPTTATDGKPLMMYVRLLVYPAASYPKNLVPTSQTIADSLYAPLVAAPLNVTSAETFEECAMVAGHIDASTWNIEAGPAAVWQGLPGGRWFFLGYVGTGSEGVERGYLSWITPEDNQCCLISYNSRNDYVSTAASISHYGQPDQAEKITDCVFAKSQSEFYYRAPDYAYELDITETAPYPGEDGFVDVTKGSWYYDVVGEAARLGYIHGYNGLYFGPTGNITRGQIATVLFNMSGWTDATYDVADELGNATPHFIDVSTGDFFYKGVEWAVANGVITGYNSSEGAVFEPGDDATREQLMTMMWRYAKILLGDSYKALTNAQIDEQLATFSDGDKVNSWAREAVAWCTYNHVVTGYTSPDGPPRLAPQDPITRAETAAIGVRLQPEPPTEPLGK